MALTVFEVVWITYCVCFYHPFRDENELQPRPQLKLEIRKPKTSFMSSLLKNRISCFWYYRNCNSHSWKIQQWIFQPCTMKHISAVTQLCCLCSKSNHHPTAENWNRLHLWKWTVYLSVMQNVFKCYSSCHVEIRILLLVLLILISGKLICSLVSSELYVRLFNLCYMETMP